MNKLKPAQQSESRSDETLLQWQPPSVAVSGTRETPRAADAADEAAVEPAAGALPDALSPGDIIGDRYVIEQHISAGSFGAVYRASDRQIANHQVALKLLHVPAADEPAREAALRELTLLASVSHPSVVQFKDYGWHQGRLWFAMPWYRGTTLAMRYTDSQGPIPMTRVEARPIFERLAQGLAAMHEVGIHHHDIKPENVFLADIAGFEMGFPVLLDLGIATKRGEGPKGLTVEYASPETAAAALGVHDRPIGAAADVFSLALVLRNALEPETAPPCDGEFVALLNQRATLPIKPPGRRDMRHLRTAFNRWLSLDPSARPSAAEFAAELVLLTAPEEQRQARRKILRRLVPVLLASALAVSLLLLQVQRQKTELLAQRERLTQEMQESEALRQRSAQQLQEIEAKSEQLGSQEQRLKRAVAIGRELNGQLARAERRADDLGDKLRRTSAERDGLSADKATLTRERDELVVTRDRLQGERDALTRTRDQLQGERDELTRTRDRLQQEGDALRIERDRLDAEHKQATAERDAQSAERERLAGELESVQRRLTKVSAQFEAEEKARRELRSEVRALNRRIRTLERAAPKSAAAAAAEPADDEPAGTASQE